VTGVQYLNTQGWVGESAVADDGDHLTAAAQEVVVRRLSGTLRAGVKAPSPNQHRRFGGPSVAARIISKPSR
jgi:hypothetical protein